jgi:hypothetical protein
LLTHETKLDDDDDNNNNNNNNVLDVISYKVKPTLRFSPGCHGGSSQYLIFKPKYVALNLHNNTA